MSQTAATQAAPNNGDSSGATRVPMDVTKVESDAVSAAMSQVTALVDGIAKAAGVFISEPAHNPADDTDVEKGGTPNFGAMRKMYQASMKESGLKGDAMAAAMAKFDKNFGGTMKTQKDIGGPGDDGDEAAAPSVDDTIEATLDTIQKAKAFTPARVAKLAEALETLQKLMMEVIPVGSSPSTKEPGVSQHSNPNTTRAALVGTQKSSDGDGQMTQLLTGLDTVLTRLEEATGATVTKRAEGDNVDIASVLKSIQGRLDAIEKARPAPQSEGDGSTTTTTQTKKSFWGGLI